MNLIVGATGLLGGQIARGLNERGSRVRALVRGSSDPDKVAGLRRDGAELVIGDLKNRPSLDEACRGADTVVSTVSCTLSRQQGDSIETVDRDGQLALVEAAEAAGVRHFVLISFPGIALDFPLQAAKRAAENRLRSSRMAYTILQPTFFSEVWLSPALGFDPAGATARVYGDGLNAISWISFEDVARFAVAALDNQRAPVGVVKLGGPAALGPLEVVRLAEQATGRAFAVEHVPEAALRAQYETATDALQQSFAGLMLYYAAGDVIEMSETLRLFRIEHLKSVQDHLQSALPTSAHAI